MKTEHDLEELLTALRGFGVSEFSQDQFGIKIKFGPERTAASKPAPATPPAGAVDPTRFDIDDVLYGAK